MSLRELADASGIDFSTISKIERGDVRLSSHHMKLLGPPLDCEPEDFVADRPRSPLERELFDLVSDKSDDWIRALIEFVKSR